MKIEDHDLADRIRAGDPEAQRIVVEAYLPQIVRVSQAAGLDRATAEDVAQSTFLTFFEKSATFEGRSQVRTWLFGILHHKIHEVRRKGMRETPTDDIEMIVDSRFDRRGNWANPPQDIEKILESAEGLASKEICKILGVTRTNLGVLFFRARNGLRECLEAVGIAR